MLTSSTPGSIKEASEPIPDRWFAVARAGSIPRDKPLSLVRFGRPVVLWRDASGTARAARHVCPHRGADLRLGRVVDGQLECRYHGFRYAGDGQCALIPCQSPDQPIHRGLTLSMLPAVEKHGFIWMGPNDTAPTADINWLDEMAEEPSAISADSERVWTSRFGRTVEAMLDLHHLAFAHRQWMPPFHQLTDYEVRVEGERIFTKGTLLHATDPKKRLYGRLDVAFPGIVQVRTSEGKVNATMAACPVDEENTWIATRYEQGMVTTPLLARLVTKALLWMEMRILEPEDERMVGRAEPRSPDVGSGNLIAGDRGIAEWYRLRRQILRAESPVSLPVIRAQSA